MTSRILSRSSSLATVTSDGTTAWSIGIGEHSLELGDRPLGDDARRGQPALHALADELAVVGHELRVGVEAGEEQLQLLRRVGLLELADLGEELLRAGHLVDDLEGVDPLLVLDREDRADDPQHVAGDPVLDGQPVVGDRKGRVAHVVGELAELGPALGARVGQAIVVAVVAVDRGAEGLELLQPLPEAVRKLVDGARLRQVVLPVRGSTG